MPRRYRRYNRRPWRVPLSRKRRRKYKAWLVRNGKLSPNFSLREAGSKDGAPVPNHLIPGAQEHAFRLERVRHRLGDKSMTPLSWYRSPQHNANVGGATQSRHMQADATDWSDGERIRLGSSSFNASMHRLFGNGGIGTANGHVRHVDLGARRRWTY